MGKISPYITIPYFFWLNSNENRMQIKLATMADWHPAIRWELPFSKTSLEFHHRPRAPKTPVDCSRALRAWIWWQLYGNCTKYTWAEWLKLNWHFSYGKSSTFFTSSSTWNLQLAVIYIYIYSHICTHTHIHYISKIRIFLYISQRPEKEEHPLCKGLTRLWLASHQSGCKWFKNFCYFTASG